MPRSRTLASVLSVVLLVACGSDPAPGAPTGGGRSGSPITSSGGAGGRAGGAGAGGGGGMGMCPAAAPSGTCTDTSLTCRYIDAQGCPETFSCFEYLGNDASWTTRISEPGGSCSNPGQVCTYEETIGDNLPSYGALECGTSGKWEPHSLCPASMPMSGESCGFAFLSCSYQACGGTRLAYCNGPKDGWAVEACPDAGP